MARYSRTQTITHDIGTGGRLSVKVTSADVRVRAREGDAAIVRASFDIPASSEQEADAVLDEVKLQSSTAPGELTVSEPNAAGGSGLGAIIGRMLAGRGDVDFSVEIELPRGASLELETVSGEVTADGLRGTQHYVTVSGDLFVDDTAGDLRVDTVSGDVVIRAELPVGAQVNAVSGDLSLTAPRLESLRLHTVSGDIEAEGELSAAGTFRVETVSGDFDIGLVGSATIEVRGIATDISSDVDHRIEGRLDRRRLVIGTGQPLLTFSSMSGDLGVRRPRRLPAAPPAAPLQASPPDAPSPPSAQLHEDEQLAVLQALERGEIDVDEAARRLGGGGSDA
jgi:hypothetical protein